METPLNVVFLWHFHQPCYLNHATGFYHMPWVRLHAIKDYSGFSRLLSRFPDVKATFNITPVLAEQILDIGERRAEDQYLKLSYRPADTLTDGERVFILRNFFSLNWDTMLVPFPRYRQLLQKRGRTTTDEEIEKQAVDFSVAEIRDLQVLFNLAWFHPLLRSEDQKLTELVRKGRNFSETEKTVLLDCQYEIIRGLIPEWRRMQDSGQIEISVSPYYHPILPLLLKNPALAQDVVEQVRSARQFSRQVFGREPAGCWPSEGAISPEILELLAREGFQWAASDEDILFSSLAGSGPFDRNRLYQPHVYRSAGAEISLLFRDRMLSDRIGFDYRFRSPESAAEDFFAELQQIRRNLPEKNGRYVGIILDGENAWEYYPDEGVPFLTGLYATLSRRTNLRTATVSGMLAEGGEQPVLNRVHSGSWINRDFHIWAGYPAADKAWMLLEQARRDAAAAFPENSAVRKSILAAEGSDWFWWYSPEHHSGRDDEFDALFRLFLINAYRLRGAPEPEELLRAILKSEPEEIRFPRNPINAEIDGRETSFFEWLGAGHSLRDNLSGAMHYADDLCRTFYFGWNQTNFYLRIDFAPFFAEEGGLVFQLDFGPDQRWSFQTENGKISTASSSLKTAEGKIIEIALPWQELNLPAGSTVDFFLEVRRGERLVDRFPRHGVVKLTIPGSDYQENF